MKLTHLQCLEAESIHIMREVVAECERPVMLYSVGKDSATMLHLARKAFYPAPPPFPLLHVDTTWKFREMYALRDQTARDSGMALLVWHNPEAVAVTSAAIPGLRTPDVPRTFRADLRLRPDRGRDKAQTR